MSIMFTCVVILLHLYNVALGKNFYEQEVINVKMLGAKGDGTSNDTRIIQNALTSNSNKIIFFPEGSYLLDSLILASGIELKGQSATNTKLITTVNTRRKFISGKDISNFSFSGISLLNKQSENVSLLIFESSDDKISENINIHDCLLRNDKYRGDGIVFFKKVKNIAIDQCNIQLPVNSYHDSTYLHSACIKIVGLNERHDVASSPFKVVNCRLTGGNVGFSIVTKGIPPSPITFINNTVSCQNVSGAIFYHATLCYVRFNTFENIHASSLPNNDGGVVWLDQAGEGKVVFFGNIIRNCSGNGLFIEELHKADISDNEISHMAERAFQYERNFEGVKYHSVGGNGMLITGGAVDINIANNNISNCTSAALILNRYLGVHLKFLMDSIAVNLNKFYLNKNAITIIGRVNMVSVNKNTFLSNGVQKVNREDQNFSAVSNYHCCTILIEGKLEHQDLKELSFTDNIIDRYNGYDFPFHGICKTYPGGKFKVNNNRMNVKGDKVYWKAIMK